MEKPKVLLLGKLPPPYMGPAIATSIILASSLSDKFDLLHVDTTINKSIGSLGKKEFKKIGINISIYRKLIVSLIKHKPAITLIPISQTTLGFVKDAGFILLAAFLSKKVLLQLRGSNLKSWLNSSDFITKAFVKYCFRKSDGVIVLGNNLRHLFEDYFREDQIFVVPNGCDISIPKEQGNKEVIEILYFANFLESKGILDVLKAVAILNKKNTQKFKLKAVGAWNNATFEAACFSLVKDNKLPVEFCNVQSGQEKWQTYANADIFVFTPNMPEGHPWVMVEALAAGLPIISTNQGAIVESVSDQKNGFIVESKSAGQIAEKLTQLLENSEMRQKMGQSSRAHYLANFTEEKMVENLTQTFNCLINVKQ